MSRAAGEAGEPKPAAQLAEPGRFWIRYVPRSWEGPERPWLDLAAGRLVDGQRGGRARAGKLPDLAEAGLDDVLYLPPVPPGEAAARDLLAGRLLVGGTPLLVHLLPGEETTLAPDAGAALVFDLLGVLLEGDLEALRRLPSGSSAVWPLLPGSTDDPQLWERGCAELAAAGARCAQALAPALEPADRRWLAERRGGEETFEALFHRQPPAERDFAVAAWRHGLQPFVPRPLPRGGAANRWIGGVVALTGELWLRLGRPVEQGQAFCRAARWIDRAPYDLTALAREGNLAVLPIDPASREVVAECAGTGQSARLARLLAEYVTPEESGADASRRTADAQTVET